MSIEKEPEPRRDKVLVAKGSISKADQTLALSLLQRLGISGEFLDEGEYRQRIEFLATKVEVTIGSNPNKTNTRIIPTYSIFDIIDPETYVVKEHFQSFQEVARARGLKISMGTVFTYLATGVTKGPSYRKGRLTALQDLVPPNPVITARRTEVGFETDYITQTAYSLVSEVSAQTAIQAGSIALFAQQLQETPAGISKTTDKAVILIGNQLQSQFK